VTAAALAWPLSLRPARRLESRRPWPFYEAAITGAETRSSDVDDARLLTALRGGDEAAFAQLVARHHRALKGLARSFGATEAVADEIVQETWLAALNGFERFEARSSLKTWLFGILKNQARQRGRSEHRSVPFSALAIGDDEGDGPSVDPDRFQEADGCWPGHWAAPPRPWEDPGRRLAALEARERIRAAISALPLRQRVVVALRDVDGLEAEEVCGLLEISEANQRVLLHRGRAQIRNALEEHLDG
jgi:RNA polymerase sigma-70 factor (ECF subfamily)